MRPEVASDALSPEGRRGGSASWRALGTHVHLRTADPELIDVARHVAADVLDEVDRACSRFRDDSDLSRANLTSGPTPVSPVLVGAVRVALEAAEVTGGLVDPTLGRLLVGAGYARTFALVPADDPTPVSLPGRRAGWRELVVTDETVTVPATASLDLGATGKAYAADLVALTLCRHLSTPVVVSVGGDVRAAAPDECGDAGAGSRPDAWSSPAVAWPVVVANSAADLDRHGPTTSLRLVSGGIATSSVTARRWVRGGREWHHVFDPRTGEPVSGPWVAATALGPTCVAANTASTAALVLGADAPGWLEEHGVAALLVGADGSTLRSSGWVAAGVEDAMVTW
ncbi:FAD:protein FMN transferase [Terrabacter sp. LjRoot27]|jgi:thiamine biosynthesis lipoprotein|uniref:FAD:protein FMN transferase n=1 Tax=Terrabacter sp. LjRoot27 TaxID=3342306 RepID=UPI003ECDA4EC